MLLLFARYDIARRVSESALSHRVKMTILMGSAKKILRKVRQIGSCDGHDPFHGCRDRVLVSLRYSNEECKVERDGKDIDNEFIQSACDF